MLGLGTGLLSGAPGR